MARFYGGTQGNRGAATRLGVKSSGIESFAQGWNSGVKVYGYVDDDDRDVFQVYATGGSNGATSPQLIATIVDGIVQTTGTVFDVSGYGTSKS